VQGGVSRYDLPNPVTVPNRSATMVLLAVRNVPGESMYLFAPDGGVPDSATHPFHVARFENRSGAMLERGPLAIFETGSFLGQGMLDPLPDGATATVPFALERALAVDSNRTGSIEGARLVRIQHNQITVERYRIERTTYRGRNGMDHAVRVSLRHGLSNGVRLHEPPSGTTQTDAAALVPLQLPARGNAQVELQTRVPFTIVVDWANEQAAEAIRAYLQSGHPSDAIATALHTALDLRQQLEDLARDRGTVDQQLNDLRQNADETRLNLLTIQRNPTAADLRAQLTQRLAQMATQIDTLTRRIVEIDTQIGERRVRLSELTRGLEVDGGVASTH
jgi:chaperonin cofactor prefoldin